ncbi:MAG: hypothetical protein ACXAC2_01145 [Candidatus Kariarchaeaceae archaeon]
MSIRISSDLSKKIDEAVDQNPDVMKNRSDFGLNAIILYLDHLMKIPSIQQDMASALVAVAKTLDLDLPEVQRLQKYASELSIELHPAYEKILDLKSRLFETDQKELGIKLRSASYNELDAIYEEFTARFFLNGTGSKADEHLVKRRKKVAAKKSS